MQRLLKIIFEQRFETPTFEKVLNIEIHLNILELKSFSTKKVIKKFKLMK